MKELMNTSDNSIAAKIPGLFVGLCGMDIVYYSDCGMPADNSKKKLTDYFMAIGGPAANAAITYSLLGGEAYLLCSIGDSPMGDMVKTMLSGYRVRVIDISEGKAGTGNISCIHVNTTNGDRTILSGQSGERVCTEQLASLKELAEKCRFALYDGNLPGVEEMLVQQLQFFQKDLVLDAGSYKAGFPVCFTMKPTVISSEGFTDEAGNDVFALHKMHGFAHSAQTRGGRPVRCEKDGRIGELLVREAAAVDTLGAGDICHGAYCYFKYVQNLPFEEALSRAAEFASFTVEKRGVVAGIDYAKSNISL